MHINYLLENQDSNLGSVKVKAKTHAHGNKQKLFLTS